MKKIKKILLGLSFVLAFHYGYASTDPVRWEQTAAFPSTVITEGGTYVASYLFVSQLPFTMVSPLIIGKTTNASSEVTYDDLCSGKKLSYREPCTVTIYLNPRTPGRKIVRLTEIYGNNQVALPEASSVASSNSGGTDVSGVVTTALPTTMNVGASASWRFTFTNSGTSSATGVELVVNGATGYNTTCGTSLSNTSPTNACYIEGTYTASSASPHTIQATFSYAQGAPVSLSTSTTGSGESSGLVCSRAIPLAPEVLVNSSSPVTLLCTNKSGSALDIDSHVATFPTGGAQGTFTPDSGGDNCTAQTLPNNASCQLKGTYVAPGSAQSNITISLLVNYHTPSTAGLSSSTSTSTDVVTHIDNERTIQLINNCDFDVWWSMVGGAITDTPACTSDSDCPTGSTCNVSAKICYYNNYGPTTGSYYLEKSGGTATTQIIQTDASTLSDEILWKGLISASTNCSGTVCQNNGCQNNGGTTSCTAGVGFDQPATEAEFTFQLTGAGNVDTYDISNVNGFSMPISMGTNQSASDYECGTAGNNVAAGSLNACNFSNVTPPTNMYYWVTLTNTACTSQNTCSDASQICGLAFSSVANNYVKNCGDFLGYWAANQICQTNPNFSSPFGDNFTCKQVLGSPFPSDTYTLTQLLKCSPPVSSAPLFNSCYLSYSGYSSSQIQQCCGCSNWTGVATPSENCPATDPQWTKYVHPLILWMKSACPTSYSYPYDDKASTFQCTAAAATEYTITFCPGGGTGLPAGKTDGRETP